MRNDINELGKTNNKRVISIINHLSKFGHPVVGIEKSDTDYEEHAYIHTKISGFDV